ncbi:MAG: hypothetical protein ACK55I_42845 [bacterium]
MQGFDACDLPRSSRVFPEWPTGRACRSFVHGGRRPGWWRLPAAWRTA